MPLPVPALIALGAELLKVIPWGKKNAERIEEVAPVLVSIAKTVAPDGSNEQAAVEAVMRDKETQAQFVAATAVRWSDVAPFMEFESRERKAAREFTAQMTSEGPAWRQIGYGALVGLLSLVIVGGIGYTFWQVLFAGPDGAFSQSTRDGIVEVMKNILILVVGFFFGSSASNRQKDQTISEQAKR